MKNIKIIFLGTLFILGILWSCSPDLDEIQNINKISKTEIDSIVVKPDYKVLVANGKNKIQLKIFAYSTYKGEKYQIPEERLEPEWFKYEVNKGQIEDGTFSTSDVALAGQTIEASAKVKDLNIKSNTVSFTITSPLEDKFKKPVTIPVVFHVIQTKNEIEQYANTYDKEVFYKILTKMNNVFQGKLSDAGPAVNTNITFKPAIYGSNGVKLPEAGIHRIQVDKVEPENGNYNKLIEDNDAFWSPKQYLNIWLISDFKGEQNLFAFIYTNSFAPQTFESGTPIAGLPLVPYDVSNPFSIEQSGVLYKLQSLSNFQKGYQDSVGRFLDNELIFYVGKYLGLLPTYEGYDFCDDTHNNEPNNNNYKEVNGYHYLAENIMNEGSGMHTFISKEQAERVRWVLENCPERASWKSKFAFTGK